MFTRTIPFHRASAVWQKCQLKLTSLQHNKYLFPASIAAGLLTGSIMYLSSSPAYASESPNPPHYPWSHQGWYSGFDSAALRRGFEVYRQVCSTCHSLEHKSYRELVGVTHTEEHAKAIARSIEVTDGPNDQGEMFQRPGKLFDRIPKPYPNEEYGRFINNGAYPPDLSLIVLGRHYGEDYVFSILTGYHDAPDGVALREGLHYNVYFPGNAIAMAKPLSDGIVEFEDDTPSTESQAAKDVVTFLSWCAQPEYDERKRNGMKIACAFVLISVITGYHKRFWWAPLKTRRITYSR